MPTNTPAALPLEVVFVASKIEEAIRYSVAYKAERWLAVALDAEGGDLHVRNCEERDEAEAFGVAIDLWECDPTDEEAPSTPTLAAQDAAHSLCG